MAASRQRRSPEGNGTWVRVVEYFTGHKRRQSKGECKGKAGGDVVLVKRETMLKTQGDNGRCIQRDDFSSRRDERSMEPWIPLIEDQSCKKTKITRWLPGRSVPCRAWRG